MVPILGEALEYMSLQLLFVFILFLVFLVLQWLAREKYVAINTCFLASWPWMPYCLLVFFFLYQLWSVSVASQDSGLRLDQQRVPYLPNDVCHGPGGKAWGMVARIVCYPEYKAMIMFWLHNLARLYFLSGHNKQRIITHSWFPVFSFLHHTRMNLIICIFLKSKQNSPSPLFRRRVYVCAWITHTIHLLAVPLWIWRPLPYWHGAEEKNNIAPLLGNFKRYEFSKWNSIACQCLTCHHLYLDHP